MSEQASGVSVNTSEYYSLPANADTKGFIMQQTMMRIKDPVKSLDFYTKVLGMRLVMSRDFPKWGFSLYFVGYCDPADIPTDTEEQWVFCVNLPGCVELTYNYGSEKEEGRPYHTGNTYDGVKGGFGHIGISVPDVYEACERFHKLGVEFQKSPNSGGMKGLAFIKDPDGYWIEVLSQVKPTPVKDVDCLGVRADAESKYTGGGGGK